MKHEIKAIIMLILSAVLFVTVIFAWFSLYHINQISPLDASIIKREWDMEFEYSINNEGYTNFQDSTSLNTYLSNIIPGDLINVKIILTNKNNIGDSDMDFNVKLFNMTAQPTSIEYNLLDFYFINNGLINFRWFESNAEYALDNSYLNSNVILDVIDANSIEYLGYDLEQYRISNVFNHQGSGMSLTVENSMTVFEASVASKEVIVIEFSIGLDPYTPDKGVGFQAGQLLVDGFYTVVKE